MVKTNTTSAPLKITSVEKYKEIIKDMSKQKEEQQKQLKNTIPSQIQLPLLSLVNDDFETVVDDTTDTESVCSMGYLQLKHEMQDDLRKLVHTKNI